MSKRHTENANLVLYTQPHYKGFPVITSHGPLIENYLDRIYETIHCALREHPRVVGFRVDLRLPLNYEDLDTRIISRFIESLKAQIKADQMKSARMGSRKHFSRVRYVWVREQNSSQSWHYHVLILFNQDAYKWLGRYDKDEGNMSARIKRAWASALGWPLEQCKALVHFPDNPVYRINTNAAPYIIGLPDLFYRVSYFAKVNTKHYGDFSKQFGSSRL